MYVLIGAGVPCEYAQQKSKPGMRSGVVDQLTRRIGKMGYLGFPLVVTLNNTQRTSSTNYTTTIIQKNEPIVLLLAAGRSNATPR